MLFRMLSCTGQRPPADQQRILRRQLAIKRQDKLVIDDMDFPFEQAAQAWAVQVSGPRAKVKSRISQR